MRAGAAIIWISARTPGRVAGRGSGWIIALRADVTRCAARHMRFEAALSGGQEEGEGWVRSISHICSYLSLRSAAVSPGRMRARVTFECGFCRRYVHGAAAACRFSFGDVCSPGRENGRLG